MRVRGIETDGKALLYGENVLCFDPVAWLPKMVVGPVLAFLILPKLTTKSSVSQFLPWSAGEEGRARGSNV